MDYGDNLEALWHQAGVIKGWGESITLMYCHEKEKVMLLHNQLTRRKVSGSISNRDYLVCGAIRFQGDLLRGPKTFLSVAELQWL